MRTSHAAKDPAPRPRVKWAGLRRGSGGARGAQGRTVGDGARAARGVRRVRQLPGRQQSGQSDHGRAGLERDIGAETRRAVC